MVGRQQLLQQEARPDRLRAQTGGLLAASSPPTPAKNWFR